jgi:RNA polymerase sigma-70 factor (ECF subfamily)
MSGSEEAAEDVVQEAFLILLRGARGFDPVHGSLQSYLYGIGRNLLAQRLREPAMEGLEGVEPVAESDPLDGLTREEQMEMVRRALVMLPAEYREAVVLCDLEEMSYADAAELQGCPVGTIRSRLSRAREMLSARVQELRVRA